MRIPFAVLIACSFYAIQSYRSMSKYLIEISRIYKSRKKKKQVTDTPKKRKVNTV